MSVAVVAQGVPLFRQTESLNMSDGQAHPVCFAQHHWVVFKPQAAWGGQHLWVVEHVMAFFNSSETTESHLASRTQKQWQATHKLMWPSWPPAQIVVGPKMKHKEGLPTTEIFRQGRGYVGDAASLGPALHKPGMPTSLLMAMAAYDVKCARRDPPNRLSAGALLVRFIKGIIDAANSKFVVHMTLPWIPCGGVRSETLETGILTGLENYIDARWQTNPLVAELISTWVQAIQKGICLSQPPHCHIAELIVVLLLCDHERLKNLGLNLQAQVAYLLESSWMACIIQRCSEAPLLTMAQERHRPLSGSFKQAMLELAKERGKPLAEVLGPYYRNDMDASKAALAIQKEWCLGYLNVVGKEIGERPEFDGTLEAIFDKSSFPPDHVAICYSTSGQFQ